MSYKSNNQKVLYSSDLKEPFKLSRSKIDLFIECPRCFYLDCKLGVKRPPGFPFTLNSAVDTLLKNEFDFYRRKRLRSPLLKKYNIEAIPTYPENHNLNSWRDNFTGVQHFYKPCNFLIFGAIDDLWINKNREYIVVDYKSTSKREKIESLDQEWHNSYKRQMEIYQWLVRQNGYKVSDIGYFVYCNANKEKEKFDAILEFDITMISYKGDDSWVEEKINQVHKCLNQDNAPEANDNCEYCKYIKSSTRL